MKFPTSITPAPTQDPNEVLEAWRTAAEAEIGEPVIAACPFARQGLISNKIAGHFGILPWLLARKRQEIRAGGLPENFLLAVTADRVHALKQSFGMGRNPAGKTGGEVAVWDRASLRVTTQPGSSSYITNVTLESPSEGEKVQCSVGRSEASDDFLRLLQDPDALA